MNKITLKTLALVVLPIILVLPSVSSAQVGAAVERAAQRAAIRAAERAAAQRSSKAVAEASSRRAVAEAADRVVKRWTSSLCKPAAPCPLPANYANNFVGGSYDEVILGRHTILYRAFSDPKAKFGAPGERFSYWSRSDSRGLQAAIDRAIPVSTNGNTAERIVAVRVPQGTRVFEGEAKGIKRGPVGGGSQIVVHGVRPEWEFKLNSPSTP